MLKDEAGFEEAMKYKNLTQMNNLQLIMSYLVLFSLQPLHQRSGFFNSFINCNSLMNRSYKKTTLT